MIKAAVVFVAAGLLSGCGPDPAGAPGSGAPAKSGSAPASVVKPAPSAAPSASAAVQAPDERRGKMSNCPSAVEKAKTEIKDTPKGVEITVTAADKEGTDEIRKRGKSVTEHAKADAAKGQHTGAGGSGGSMGRCPIVIGGTDIVVADVDGGAKFTVDSKDPKELDWLRREAKERLAQMGAGDTKGERKMANCASAVTGAKTTVKEAGGAIVVTVLAKDPKDEASVKDIRARAKKSSELKHDGSEKSKTHDGGGGGSADGRCPGVLEGTTATVKDVDGGVEVTLKPKTAADLKKLSAEASDRAKRFD